MYQFNLNYKKFVYPWAQASLADRLSALSEKSKHKKVIVYIYEKADATFRYRIYNMCEQLNKKNDYFATYFFFHEFEQVTAHLDKVDHMVFVRVKWSVEFESFLCRVISKKIKTYFDVDDLVYDIAKIPLLMNHTCDVIDETVYAFWFSYVSRICLAASYCDAYITTNSFLASQMQSFFKKDVFIAPNFLNDKQKAVSDAIWDVKKEKNISETEADKILLGYFSGTLTHNNDFKLISHDLFELMNKNENVSLRIVGCLTLPKILKPFVEKKRIHFMPFQNYLDLQVKIAECDVNMVPLKVNTFTNGKSELKFFEAAIVGTLTVASPTQVYLNNIKDGDNGYIAQPYEWGQKLATAILNRENQKIIETAHVYAEENYYGPHVLAKLEKVFS